MSPSCVSAFSPVAAAPGWQRIEGAGRLLLSCVTLLEVTFLTRSQPPHPQWGRGDPWVRCSLWSAAQEGQPLEFSAPGQGHRGHSRGIQSSLDSLGGSVSPAFFWAGFALSPSFPLSFLPPAPSPSVPALHPAQGRGLGQDWLRELSCVPSSPLSPQNPDSSGIEPGWCPQGLVGRKLWWGGGSGGLAMRSKEALWPFWGRLLCLQGQARALACACARAGRERVREKGNERSKLAGDKLATEPTLPFPWGP